MQRGFAQSFDDKKILKDTILKSLSDNNVVFVTAQPDTTYFHWQVEIYLYQFAKQGVLDRCYALFGYVGSSPTEYAKNLAKKYPCIKFYKDTRPPSDYSPTIRPHILAKFFKDNPQIGKNVFYHDSDIFLTHLPRFDLMLAPDDDNAYLSDTISYIGYNYIKDCSGRYKSRYSNLPDLDIFNGMCGVVGIDPDIVIRNERNSGGAQYLLKNIDYKFWEECEVKCYKLYDYLSKYEKKYPISNHIQKWTTDMWVVLWLYWKKGGHSLIHKELDFSWATGTVKEYNSLNIFHLAGITGDNCSDKFHKGRYTKQTVFDAYFNDPSIFDHIDRNNATYEYVGVIKEYVHNVYLPEKGLILDPNIQHSTGSFTGSFTRNITIMDKQDIIKELHRNVTKFKMNVRKSYAGVYVLDTEKKCCGKHIWRSINKGFIIFWSGASWVLTYSKYESQIGADCGGLISTLATHPFGGGWNGSEMTIDLE